MEKIQDPVIYLGEENNAGYDEGFYFWSESWTELYGPYVRYDEAQNALRDYAVTFNL